MNAVVIDNLKKYVEFESGSIGHDIIRMMYDVNQIVHDMFLVDFVPFDNITRSYAKIGYVDITTLSGVVASITDMVVQYFQDNQISKVMFIGGRVVIDPVTFDPKLAVYLQYQS